MLKSLSTSLTALFGLFNLIAGIWMLAQGIELRRTDKTLHPSRPGKPEKEGGPSDVWTRGTTLGAQKLLGPHGDARQLWSGGAGTAVVAALIALVEILVCRWLVNIPSWRRARTARGAMRPLLGMRSRPRWSRRRSCSCSGTRRRMPRPCREQGRNCGHQRSPTGSANGLRSARRRVLHRRERGTRPPPRPDGRRRPANQLRHDRRSLDCLRRGGHHLGVPVDAASDRVDRRWRDRDPADRESARGSSGGGCVRRTDVRLHRSWPRWHWRLTARLRPGWVAWEVQAR